jgi:hypothetical protein
LTSSGGNLVNASASVTGAIKSNGSGTYSQAACADLSNGATGCSTTVGTSATVNTGTSGATIPLNNGNNTFSGSVTFTAQPTINLNTASAPSPISGTGLLVNAADGVTGRIQVNAYGAIGAFTCARYDGTGGSPSQVQANDQICGVNAYAYGSNAALNGPIYSFRGYATDNITSGAWGSKACVATTATNTTTLSDKFCVDQAGAVTVTSSSSAAIAAGPSGATNPVWQVDASTASAVAGLKLTGAATGGTVALAVQDSGSNANLTINAKGSGTFGVATTSTGNVTIGNTGITSATIAPATILSVNGAASASPLTLSGTWFTGGSGTTTFPPLLIQPTGTTAATTLSTSGTAVVINAPSGFAGNFLDFFIAGSRQFTLTSAGSITISGGLTTSGAVTSTANRLTLSGNRSAGGLFTTSGAFINQAAATLTDTTSSGTVTAAYANSYGAVTFAASSSTTITNAYGAYFVDPVQGSNVTLTAKYALGGDSIKITGANANFSGITTGTNADTVCLKADGTLLIQAAACTISSARFKMDIHPFGATILGVIRKLLVVTFRMKDGDKNPDKNARALQMGLLAEDIAKFAPLCTLYEQDLKTPKSYRQECVIAMLVKGEQELAAANDNLARRLARLERRR